MVKAHNTLVYAIFLRMERKAIIRPKVKKILLINITASPSPNVILRGCRCKRVKSRKRNIIYPKNNFNLLPKKEKNSEIWFEVIIMSKTEYSSEFSIK